MAEMKIEKIVLEDGRKAERRTTEVVDSNGEIQTVVELHLEEAQPLRLSQRVVEKRKPFVYERKIETVDKDGVVIEQKTESVEPKIQMQTIEHLAADVAAQSMEDKTAARELLEAIKLLVENKTPVAEVKPVKSMHRQMSSSQGVQSLGLADEIAKRAKSFSPSATIVNGIVWGVIVLETLYIVYKLLA